MTAAEVAAPPRLGGYVTNLLALLEPDLPGVRERFAGAVRLAVRTDLPGGRLVFSHHTRVDRGPDGWELAYGGSAAWAEVRYALGEELVTARGVLAVANSARLPWRAGRRAASHWILVDRRHRNHWHVTDHCAEVAGGSFTGWLSDAELATALAPIPRPHWTVAARDRLALGAAVPAQPGRFRWLTRFPSLYVAARPEPDDGTWVSGTAAALGHVNAVLRAGTLRGCGRDLADAAVHHRYRYRVLAVAGRSGLVPARVADTAWAGLTTALRTGSVRSVRAGLARLIPVADEAERLLTKGN